MDSGITGTYNIGLVGLAFAIALVASYTTLDLAGRVQSALKGRRLFWLLGGAIAMGTGIWSMHFVAMLAFGLPQPVSYSVWGTLVSLLCAISASGIALWLLSQPVSSLPLLIGGGVSRGILVSDITARQQINQPELNQTAVDKAGCAVKTLSGEVNLLQDTYLQETQAGIYRQGQSHTCVSDIYEAGYDSCYLELLERFQARAYIVVPIFCGNQLWGLLATYQNSGPRGWQVAEINMVVQIGSQLGVAIQQAELLAQTQRQAEELQKARVSC